MSELRLDEIKEREGESFELLLDSGSVDLVLAKVQPLPPSGREAGAFTLTWKGPPEPVLPQAIYTFRKGEERFEIFIVPLARDPDGMRYEAVFN
ncbi:MAG TPA: hypothetical protein VFR28_09855 [Allosphingosinicella sp.]|jgi:hypothetical protein|nr:hypothetical protein [Allosphingosinicella sp.]